MDITVSLPEELAQRARAKPKGFISRVLREALEELFAEEDAVEQTLEHAKPVVLDLENEDGQRYRGRLTATKIADEGDIEVFLREDNSVILYDGGRLRYFAVEDPETELRDALSDAEYVAAMDALGLVAEIDL